VFPHLIQISSPRPRSTLFPYTTLFRSRAAHQPRRTHGAAEIEGSDGAWQRAPAGGSVRDRNAVHEGERGDRRRERGPARVHGKRSEEHTSELQSRGHLVCRLLLEKKKK